MSWEGSIVFLGTNDLEETDEFYRELIGLKLYKDQGACLIYEVPGGGMLGFCEHIEIVNKANSPILTLLTNEVDKIYNKLKEADVEIESHPERNKEFDIYHFFGYDPNGYTIEIQKFLD
jgi:catechol 2,3-dioxygenase-like lactoylglutathione lyase family enzyme